jgi:SAM-dependent methyltransferase
MTHGSISFDRAAEYYDATRGLSEEGVRRTTEALTAAFAEAGSVLEVGVGTGQVSLPLRQAGIDLVGIDIARPMLDRLLAKSGGVPPFPLVQGDATRMPFRDHVFGAGFLRWVLHLIPEWPAVVAEIARVLEPGAQFLAALGSYGGARSEIQARFATFTGVPAEPAGLSWDGWDRLDREIESIGGRKLPDLTFEERHRDDIETFVRGIEANMYSWTWAVTDDQVRAEGAADARRWAEERWGSLEEVPRETYEWRFGRYRMP